MKGIRKRFKEELQDFKEFAIKDNVINLAVGVIIGVAFKDLVDSLVKNIFTPPIGYLTAQLDFSKLFISLGTQQYHTLEEAQNAGVVVLQYGLVLNALISFLITAVVLYVIVRALSRTEKKEIAKVAKTTKKCPYCFSDIPIKAIRCPYCTSHIKPGLQGR